MNSIIRALKLRWYCCSLVLAYLLAPAAGAQPATLSVNGAETYQTLFGLGANIHYAAWTNQYLAPVIDALVDQAGLKVFRVVLDDTDWETNDVYTNGAGIDWDYFNTVYSSARFQHLWGLIGYLNQKGITNGVMLNFQGPGPAWMGQPITPGLEPAWAQMITSLLVYGRNTEGLKYNLIGPDNEMNLDPETQGVGTSGPGQYVTMLHDLVEDLDTNGVGDIQIVGPDLYDTSTNWMPDIMQDPVVMGNLAHFSIHSYNDDGAGSGGVTNWLDGTPYGDRGLWVTEYNVWCPSCLDGTGNTNGWDYSLGTAEYLLAHLANGASTALVWEGYDDIEATANGWSYWGLYAVSNINVFPYTYYPRKDFYTVAQLSKYLQPGAQHLGVSGDFGQLTVQAYYNAGLAQLSVVGVNTNETAASLTCALDSLPQFSSLNLYYTDPNTNLALAGTVPVVNGIFSTLIPPNCVFAINGQQVPPATPQLSYTVTEGGLILSWPATATNFSLIGALQPVTGADWWSVTNVPQLTNGQFQVYVPAEPYATYYRLIWP